jgi:glycosyltransferase involved in cell wall biosynthesis
MRSRIAVIADSPDENWPSMDLVAEMLTTEWQTHFTNEVETTKLELPIPRVARMLRDSKAAINADRILGRFVRYPARALRERNHFDFFHVADHSYAQVVHALPSRRTGVFCHDLDAFRSILDPAREPRWLPFRMMTKTLLAGLQRAAIVFHSTRETGRRLEAFVAPHKLVYAPYGIAAEYKPDFDPNDGADEALASLNGAPFILHVGSAIPRKRIDVLFDVFARLREKMPELRLVQQGGTLTPEQKDQARRLKIDGLILQPPKMSRVTLAGMYRRASAVLLPSDAEGFGLPVIEALACGAPVVASDIATTREVGGEVTTFVKVADVDAWVAAVSDVLVRNGKDDSQRAKRIAHAQTFSWRAHAQIILDAYRSLGAVPS